MRRQLDLLDQLVRGQPLVHPAHGLVVDIGDAVAGHAQHFLDLLGAADRPPVQRHHVLGLERAQQVEAGHPLHRITELGAAQGVDVRQGRPLIDLGADQHLIVGQVQHDFVRRLAGRMQELHRQARHPGVQALLEGDGGRDEGRRLGLGQRADASVHVLVVGRRQEAAEAVGRAHTEDGADLRALRHHVGQQGFMGVDLHLAAGHLLGTDERLHAVDVVRVEVGVDHRLDRLVADLAQLGHDLARLAHRLAGVDDDQALGSVDGHHVAELPAHRRPDVVGHPIQLLVEMRGVRLELGVDARRDLFLGQRGQGSARQGGGQNQAAETTECRHGRRTRCCYLAWQTGKGVVIIPMHSIRNTNARYA